MQQRRRVVITGMGLICPLGSSKEQLWQGLATQRSGVETISLNSLAAGLVPYAAQARQFENDDINSFGPLEKERKKAIRKGLKVMCRECQMGVAAAQLALDDAKVDSRAIDPERIGIEFGADYMLTMPEEFSASVQQCVGQQGVFDFSRWAPDGLPKMSPLWLLKYLPNMPASHVAIYNDLRGPNNSLTLREAASNAAVAEAYQIIFRGSADVMLAGATGTRLHPMKTLHVSQQEEIANGEGVPAKASRPFDANRHGMVLGEGAGAVILEEYEHAKARGATIYGELLGGVSVSAIGPRLQALREKAMTNAMRAALEAAQIQPEELGHLNAHGLSTRLCDQEEAAAIQAVFGNRSKSLPIVAAKSYFGNLGAGGGLVELIASLLAFQHGCLFPVLNYETPDPQCPVAAVRDHDTPAGGSFLNLSVTPQGQASAVIVRRV